MEDMILREIVVLFILSIIVVLVCLRFRLPSIVGFLLTGVLCGPSALGLIPSPEAVDTISAGDTVSVDFDTGVITDETNGKVFHAEPFPPFIQEIISAGGLMKSIKAKK